MYFQARGGKRALDARVDFDLARAVADIGRLRAPAHPARWLAPEPDTLDVRRARARDRWLRAHPRPLTTRGWLLRVGWRTHGLLAFDEVPG